MAILLALLFGCTAAQAQYFFDRITTSQGLSQSSVLTIFEDSRGFLWFGTVDGLNRYDGYGFQVFRHEVSNAYSVCGNEIMAIHEDAEHNIWVGTRSMGLCYLDKNTERFISIKTTTDGTDISTHDIACINHTPDGTIWLGTNTGLMKVEPGSKTVQEVSVNGQRIYVSALCTDASGQLWLGTYPGLIFRRSRTQDHFTPYTLPLSSSVDRHQQVIVIHEDTRQCLRVGTWGGGLFRWNERSKAFQTEFFLPQVFEKRNIIKGIAEDQNQNLWLATDDGAVVAPQGDFQRAVHQAAQPRKNGGLNTHALQSMHCDAFGNVWIGTWEGGLNVYYPDAKRFAHLSQADGLPSNRVTGVVANAKSILVATGRGMTLIDRQTGAQQAIAEGIDITDLLHRGSKLAAMRWNEGADFYNLSPSGVLSLIGQHRDKENPQRALLFNRLQEIIVADLGSKIFKLDLNQQTLQALPIQARTESFGVANTICEARSGKIFIGSFNQGLWIYNPLNGNIQPAGHRGKVGHEQILCLFEDARQQLWLGTNGNGLLRYRPKTDDFEAFTVEKGLPNNVVKSVIADDRQRLWLGTNAGLYCFIPERKTGRIYSEEDGLNGKEFMPRAAYKDEQGYLFFGGMHGLNYFHPDSLNEIKRQPKVYLSALRLLNKPVSPRKGRSPLQESIGFARRIRLTHQQATSVTFEYVGLFFQKNTACQYAYRLEGLDPEWNQVGTQRTATYTNLAEGHYTFRVRASSTDGVWTAQDAELQVRVLPPWYRSWWAYCTYGLGLAALLWAYRSFLVRREKLEAELRFKQREADRAHELEQLKTNFFTNVSHEFRTPLTLILDPIEQLLRQDLPAAKVQETYGVIQRNGQRLLRLINELLDLSKIEAERYTLHIVRADVVEFLEKIIQSFHFQASQKDIDLIFDCQEESCLVDFSTDALEKILFNLLANAIKASHPGSEIVVKALLLKEEGQVQRLQLSVQDWGVGIAAADQQALFSRFFQANQAARRTQLGTGIGLALTAELAKIHGGTIQFTSLEHEGSTFSVELAVNAAAFPAEWLSQGDAALSLQQFYNGEPVKSGLIMESKAAAHQVLVVEDNEELRTYLELQLAEKYHVLSAENGEKGWELAQTFLPDLVLSDVVMPLMDGIELCKKLKTTELTSHIPVILLTSKSSVESQLQGLHTGADDYQTKPFKFPLLAARIHNLIQQREQLRQRFSKGVLLQASQLDLSETDAGFLQKVIGVIEKNLENADFDVAQLEAALHLSQMQLYRKLTSLTAMSGNVFIRHIRLHRAKQLLAESNLSVAEIAFRVGFNSPSYFTRVYKKEFGVLPSEDSITG